MEVGDVVKIEDTSYLDMLSKTSVQYVSHFDKVVRTKALPSSLTMSIKCCQVVWDPRIRVSTRTTRRDSLSVHRIYANGFVVGECSGNVPTSSASQPLLY
jgi:hypothetical protein